jgi:hypothetical protein
LEESPQPLPKNEEFKAWAKSPEVVKAFENHWKELTIVVGAVGVFLTAASAIAGLAFVFGILVSPIGLVTIAITGLIAVLGLVVYYWKDIKKWGLETWEVIKNAWTGMAEKLAVGDNPTVNITVNGAPAGREGAVAREAEPSTESRENIRLAARLG